MPIITLSGQKASLKVADSDTYLDGYLIPKGYVNASYICSLFQTTWYDYHRLPATKQFLTALSEDTKIPVYDELIDDKALVFIIRNQNLATAIQGVWVHPEIALNLSHTLNEDFYNWLADQIEQLLEPKELEDLEAEVRHDKNVIPLDTKHAVELAQALNNLGYARRNQPFSKKLFKDLQTSVLCAFGFDPDDPKYLETTSDPNSLEFWLTQNLTVTNKSSDIVIKKDLYSKYLEAHQHFEYIPEQREWSQQVRVILQTQLNWEPCSPDAKYQGQRCLRGVKLKN